MSHPYAQDLVEMIEQIAEIDFKESLGLRFLGELRYRLITKEFSGDDAERIVSKIDINLPPDSMTQDQVDACAEAFSKIILNIRNGLVEQGFKHPTECTAMMAGKFSIKLN